MLQYMFAYHLFGLLWTNQFINGFGYLVIAHSVGQYYWTRGLRSEMTTFPVMTGLWIAARFHMGSVAFGAFIVAVIQFVRLLLEYLDRKTKRMQKGNPAARWIMCCLRYCLWCVPPWALEFALCALFGVSKLLQMWSHCSMIAVAFMVTQYSDI